MSSFFVQEEDDVSEFTLEDGGGELLLQEAEPVTPTFSDPVGPVGHASFQYQAIPKLFSGPQRPLGLGPDPEMTGY